MRLKAARCRQRAAGSGLAVGTLRLTWLLPMQALVPDLAISHAWRDSCRLLMLLLLLWGGCAYAGSSWRRPSRASAARRFAAAQTRRPRSAAVTRGACCAAQADQPCKSRNRPDSQTSSPHSCKRYKAGTQKNRNQFNMEGAQHHAPSMWPFGRLPAW